MTREEKSKVIAQLTAELADNSNIYLTDTSGLNAAATSNLRRACFKSGVTGSGFIETASIWAVALGMFNIEW